MNRRELIVGAGAVAAAVGTGLPAVAATPPVSFPGRPRVDYVRDCLTHILDLQGEYPLHTLTVTLRATLVSFQNLGWGVSDVFIVKNHYMDRESFIRSVMVKIKDESGEDVNIHPKTSLTEPSVIPSVLPGEQLPTMRIRIERFALYAENA